MTAAGAEAAALDHLFSAISAVTTTGLTTVPVEPTYTRLGECVLLATIQIGGLGLAVFLWRVYTRGRAPAPWAAAVVDADHTLPDDADVGGFVRGAVAFTLACEAVGAAVLAAGFYAVEGDLGRSLFKGLFHAVSAFCTAGFALQPESFRPYADEPAILLPAMALAVCGCLGLLFFRRLKGRLSGGEAFGAEAKLSLAVFVALGAGYAVAAYATDGFGPSAEASVLDAAFLSVTALTGTGFSSVSTAELTITLAVALVIPMSIGGAPSGTSGGMKLSNVGVTGAVTVAEARGDEDVRAFGETLDASTVREAAATVAAYVAALTLGIVALSAVSDLVVEDLAFEATSALGTVGLSRGITAELPRAGQAVLMVLMLAGRLGLLTVVGVVSRRRRAAA